MNFYAECGCMYTTVLVVSRVMYLYCCTRAYCFGGLRQKGVHPPIFAPKKGTPRKRLNEATVPPERPLFLVIISKNTRQCETQQGMRENLWVSTLGTPCLLSLCGVGAVKGVKRVCHEGRIRVNRLNTTVLKGLDSPDILLYRSKQYFSGCESREKF